MGSVRHLAAVAWIAASVAGTEPANAEGIGLPLSMPDRPGCVLEHPGGALRLGHDDVEVWSLALPDDWAVVRIALTPDLDGDAVREIRIALQPTTRLTLETWIVSGATGDPVFIIDGRSPFDPWRDDARDTNEDGEITFEDDLGVVLPLRLRPRLIDPPTHWDALRRSHLPVNVRAMGLSESWLAPAREGPSDDRGDRSRIQQPMGPPGPVTLRIKRVNFGNSNIITRDYNPGYGGATYTRRWFDNNDDGDADDWSAGDERAPICYTVPNPVTVTSVAFNVDPPFAINLANAQVIGSAGGITDFTSTGPLTYNASGTRITATMTGTGTFWTTIAYVSDYPITWSIFDGTTTFPGGTTRNHMYWVLLPPGTAFTSYYSLIHIGCSRAHGLSGASHVSVADAIFTEFSDRTVYRATDQLEGLPLVGLRYFTDWSVGGWSVADLLPLPGDAQCNAWADFFIRCLHAVGIDPPDEHVVVEFDRVHPDGAGAAMFVYDWSVSGTHAPDSHQPEWPHLNIWGSPGYIGNSFNWLFADFNDATGVPSQGPTANPLSLFGYHVIVNVGSRYYDPSFGNAYNSFGEFESGAFQAYGLDFSTATSFLGVNELRDVGMDLNGNGLIEDLLVPVPAIVIKPNPSGNDLKLIITNQSR